MPIHLILSRLTKQERRLAYMHSLFAEANLAYWRTDPKAIESFLGEAHTIQSEYAETINAEWE